MVRLAALLMFVLASYYIYKMVYSQWELVRKGPREINWEMVAFGLFIFELYWLYQIYHWKRIMAVLGSSLGFIHSCQMFVTNNLLAYIPGKFANIMGMAMLAKKKNVSRIHTVTTVILFQIYSLVSGVLFIAAVMVGSNGNVKNLISEEWIPFLCAGALCGIVMVMPATVNRVLALVRKITGRQVEEVRISFVDHLAHLLIYFFSWLILGLSMYFIVSGLGENLLTKVYIFEITIIIIASYLMGLLAFFVPAGFGVAELGLVYGFMKLFEPAQAVWGAASFRIAGLVTLILSYLLLLLFAVNRKQVDRF
ncbi:MAG: flippase-like domain-containing protein [Deltaproteobacteria bacterium]|nr:flippase-like domain-containing protein [Deltaproteobacteria bacterium]